MCYTTAGYTSYAYIHNTFVYDIHTLWSCVTLSLCMGAFQCMWCGYAGVHACALSIRDVHFTGIRYIGYRVGRIPQKQTHRLCMDMLSTTHIHYNYYNIVYPTMQCI